MTRPRYTFVLAAMADGKKLKQYVVFRCVQRVAELSKIPGVIVAYSRNGWINEKLTKDWAKYVLRTLIFRCRLLVWDACRYHLMPSVKNTVYSQTSTNLSIIPGGLTSQVQLTDLCWNKAFKFVYGTLSTLSGC